MLSISYGPELFSRLETCESWSCPRTTGARPMSRRAERQKQGKGDQAASGLLVGDNCSPHPNPLGEYDTISDILSIPGVERVLLFF